MVYSVITASYNQLDWLRFCALSIRDQAHEGLRVEHIVQDAGTPGMESFLTDFSALVGVELESVGDGQWRLAAGSWSMRVHQQTDGGMYDAINRGFDRASGDFCSFLNCDEQYLPGALRAVVARFESGPACEVLFGDALLVNPEGAALSYRRAVLPSRLHTRLLHLNTLSCATFLRRSVLDAGIRFDTSWRVIGDAYWVDRMLERRLRMGLLPRPLATFAITGERLSDRDEGPESERVKWRDMPGAPPHWLTAPVALGHRLKKLMAGAYRRRDFVYEIFTDSARAQRTSLEARGVGYRWPETL